MKHFKIFVTVLLFEVISFSAFTHEMIAPDSMVLTTTTGNHTTTGNQLNNNYSFQEKNVKRHRENKDLWFGIEAGPNLSFLKYSNSGNPSSTGYVTNPGAGFRAGLVLDLCTYKDWMHSEYSKYIFIEYGIFYNEFNTKDSTRGSIWTLSTVDVPLVILFKTGFNAKAHFFAGLGICYRYVASADKNLDGKNYSLKLGNDSTDNLNSHHWAGVGQIGFEFPKKFYLRLEGKTSLNNILPDQKTKSRTDLSDISLSFGYFIGHRLKH